MLLRPYHQVEGAIRNLDGTANIAPVSFLLLHLVYFWKFVTMATGKCNIARSIWRSLEILLFFVISVVGFNVFFKATSLNSKSKAKSLSREMVTPRELSVPENSLSRHYGLPWHQFERLHHGITNHNRTELSTLSPLILPENLLQQNRVLLI